ncbi:MAG TPA: M48 family peptidase [Verrucomicrobia bacterium]|nr:MAG: metal-dependent hydrolase [Lentisphaerae bacterium GWF2_57_35]HBA84809.1 M48 family peptidase [Verrucomicrobiota bacterium]
MNALPYGIHYGRMLISFELLFARRKTMKIAVYPDERIIVKAPKGMPLEEVKERVLRRSRWIIKQLNYFKQFEPRTPPRRYVSGETHLYLGKQYRLKVKRAEQNRIKLCGGQFQILLREDPSPRKIKSLFDRWYAEKAEEHFAASVDRCWPAFEKRGVSRPNLKIRRMKTRWGSLSGKGNLTLNIALIRTPRSCIDYVVVHELCHLIHRHHGSGFYRLLEQFMPDWKKHKARLETLPGILS